MSKQLFHHLVIENEVRKEADAMIQEAKKGFLDRTKYEGLTKNYQPSEEEDPAGKTTRNDPIEPQRVELVTTVPEKLDYVKKYLVKLLDFEATKDCTNVKAKADLVVNGEVMATDLPATLLLQLEKRLREVRNLYVTVPTLDLSKKWEPTGEEDQYKYGPLKTYKKEKRIVPILMAAATDKHPAQVKESTKDVVIGEFETTHFTGAVHPRLKAEWLGRIDTLIEACKTARMEANEAELMKSDVGSKLFSFIHADDVQLKSDLK
jgi:hypothetical protein